MLISILVHQVLLGQVNWQAVLLVGLCTYLTYSLDNLFDWGKDQENYPDEQKMIRRYQRISILLMLLSLAGVLWILFESTSLVKVGLLLLGALVLVATARLSIYRSLKKQHPETPTRFILNRVFITTVWTMVCVFLPILFAQVPIKHTAWHLFGILWLLIFCYAVIWKLEKTEPALATRLVQSRLPLWLNGLCLSAALLIIIDVLAGFFPARSLIFLVFPISSFFFLRRILHPWQRSRRIVTTLFLVEGILVVVATLIYALLP